MGEKIMGIIYNFETEDLPENVICANDNYYLEYDVNDDLYTIYDHHGMIQWEYEYDGERSRQYIITKAKKEMQRLEYQDIELQAIAEMRAGV